MHSRKKITIIGTGYVGMACAIGFAEIGHQVVGYDIISERVTLLQRGVTPYRESGLAESLARHLREGRTTFVHDLDAAVAGADYIIIAVGTPSCEDGRADLNAIFDVIEKLRGLDLSGATVVVRSTVPPGTSTRIAGLLAGRADVAYAPEFLREGSAVSDFLKPDRIVVGADDEAVGAEYCQLFAAMSCPMLVMSLVDAEVVKIASNAFLAMKITFSNLIANLCDEIDGDALRVLEGIGADDRIGRRFLHPGIGFGGPCFEKDLKSLTHVLDDADISSSMLEATLELNDRQPSRIVALLREEVGEDLSGLKVGVWGLTFKGGTSDLRDSLALKVVDDLLAAGCVVSAFDPAYRLAASALPFEVKETPLAAADADVLVVLNDWSQFAQVDARAISSKVALQLVIDGRNVLDAEAMSRVGLRYRGIGRRRNPPAVALAETG